MNPFMPIRDEFAANPTPLEPYVLPPLPVLNFPFGTTLDNDEFIFQPPTHWNYETSTSSLDNQYSYSDFPVQIPLPPPRQSSSVKSVRFMPYERSLNNTSHDSSIPLPPRRALEFKDPISCQKRSVVFKEPIIIQKRSLNLNNRISSGRPSLSFNNRISK